jgi:hypothetical protein
VNRGLVGVGLVLGVALGLATACSGSGGSGSSAEEVAAAPYEAEDAGGGGGEPAAESNAEPDATGQGDKSGAGDRNVSQPGVDRSLVRTATIELAAADVVETVGRARDIVATAGGFAGQEEVREDAAKLTLRVPSDRFDRALDELSGLGKVVSRDQTAEDVTEKVVDLESRITTQRASVARVRALLARASTVEEIVRIEQEVTTRESDLESLEQRRQALAGQVAMSTVTVRIAKTAAPPPPRQEESSGFLAGLSDGWGAFLDTGAGALRVFGAMLPFLLVLAIPAVPAIRWWRHRRTTATAPQQP